MPNKTKRSKANDNYFKLYKSNNLQHEHKLNRIMKHLKLHPNDQQSKDKL